MLSIRLCTLFPLLFVHIALSTSQSPISFRPVAAPSPAPELSDAPSVAPDASAPVTAPLSSFSSPPAPPPSDLAPETAPTTSTLPPSPDSEPPVPSPSPSSASDINHSGVNPSIDDTGPEKHSGGNGMSGGKKAGIAFMVIFLAGLVVVGATVYKKRQENIRRSRYSSNARLDFT